MLQQQVGRRIKFLRNRQNISQEKLALMADIEQSNDDAESDF